MAFNNSSIHSVRRSAKNVVYNFTEAQVKVREATSNDPWGPSSSLMSEIADLTNNAMAFTEIMQMIWKRLNDHGKNWRHVYKSLVLLDYLVKTGSDKVAQQCKENIYTIETLKDFQHIEDNKDQGMNVREKAKQMVTLLKDEERLKNERTRAQMARKRFAQNSMGISSDGSTHQMRRSAGGRLERSDSQLEEARPTSSGEEELQLQIALALSREEAQREEELTKGDDVRLQLALSESKERDRIAAGGSPSSQQQSTSASAIDDLLSLNQPAAAAARPASDPWGHSGASAAPAADPWAPAPPPGPSVKPAVDPWGLPANTGPTPPLSNDPWAPVQSNSNPPPPSYSAITADMNGHSSPWNNQNGNASAWNLDPLMTNLPPPEATRTMAENRAASNKTPETFLGENSALVNLDDLMGPSKPAAPPMPTKGASPSNPFQTSVLPTTANPFLAQQRPSPTLNEMRAHHGNPGSGGADWGLPQPLEPQQTATNPFL